MHRTVLPRHHRSIQVRAFAFWVQCRFPVSFSPASGTSVRPLQLSTIEGDLTLHSGRFGVKRGRGGDWERRRPGGPYGPDGIHLVMLERPLGPGVGEKTGRTAQLFIQTGRTSQLSWRSNTRHGTQHSDQHARGKARRGRTAPVLSNHARTTLVCGVRRNCR